MKKVSFSEAFKKQKWLLFGIGLCAFFSNAITKLIGLKNTALNVSLVDLVLCLLLVAVFLLRGRKEKNKEKETGNSN